MEIIRVPIASLVLDDENPRVHNEHNLDTIAQSLTRFGQVEPLVVQKSTRRIIGGNGRVMAMKSMGWTECDIVEVDLTGDKARALGLLLNRSAELAEWNPEVLDAQISELEEAGWKPEELDAIGFSEEELRDLMPDGWEDAGGGGSTETQEDEAPEPQEKAITRPGDLWLLGAYYQCDCGEIHELP